MRTHATRRERFLPYRYARSGLELSIERCLLDDRDELAPDDEASAIDLDVRWTTATLDMRIELPQETRDRVLAPGTPPDAIDVLVIVRCPATFFRSAVRVPMRRGHAKLSLMLERDQLAGLAELEAVAVRTTTRSALRARQRARRARERARRSHRGLAHLAVADRPRAGAARGVPRHPLPPLLQRAHGARSRSRQPLPAALGAGDTRALDQRRSRAHRSDTRQQGDGGPARALARGGIRSGLARRLDPALHACGTRLRRQRGDELRLAGRGARPLLRDVFPELRSVAERRDRLAELWGELPLLLARLDAALQRRADVSAHLSKLIEDAGERG